MNKDQIWFGLTKSSGSPEVDDGLITNVDGFLRKAGRGEAMTKIEGV